MLDVIGPDGEPWYRIDIPILGTIRDCEPTDFGWRGIMPNGGVMESRSSLAVAILRWSARRGLPD